MNKEQIMGIIRHTLTFVGGILVIKGLTTEAVAQEVIGAVLTAVGAVWSVLSNKASKA
jgi:hypothetical protein